MINLDDELDNWRRTVRAGKTVHLCGSAEKHYRPERELLDLTGDAPERVMPLRVRDGWRCELAWRSLPSVRTRLLLSWHYVRNASIELAARRAKIDQRKAKDELSRGRAALLVILQRR